MVEAWAVQKVEEPQVQTGISSMRRAVEPYRVVVAWQAEPVDRIGAFEQAREQETCRLVDTRAEDAVGSPGVDVDGSQAQGEMPGSLDQLAGTSAPT
jgi:hypothetical protein